MDCYLNIFKDAVDMVARVEEQRHSEDELDLLLRALDISFRDVRDMEPENLDEALGYYNDKIRSILRR
jgi:hypothetical protein